jgi:predicted Zn-dependent peptidase
VTEEGFSRTDLPAGPTVLTETMSGVRSVSVGIWVRSGSLYENAEEMGVSHLLEHMVFKGTRRRSARDLALALERVGGSLDAYTTREYTGFQAKVRDADLGLAIDVLSDLVLDPLLRMEDLELEREVVLEEISTVEDTPDDLVFDLHAQALWGDHPYGYSILGTRETVSRLTTEDLARVHARSYRPSELVLAAAGAVDHDELLELAASLFPAGNGPTLEPPSPPPVAEWGGEGRVIHSPRAAAQTHLVFGAPTFGHRDPRRYAMILLANAFGGGMSSRLFQRVREELGLAYSVYAYQSFYADAGVCGVYVGTRPEWAKRAEQVIRGELRLLAEQGVTAEELEDVRGQVKGHLVLSLESSGARLNRLAGLALYQEPFLTLDEIAARVDAITLDEVSALAAEYFDPDRQLLLRLGPES